MCKKITTLLFISLYSFTLAAQKFDVSKQLKGFDPSGEYELKKKPD